MIEIQGLKQAFKVFYNTKERYSIELEEIVRQLYSTELEVDQKLIESMIIISHDESDAEMNQ